MLPPTLNVGFLVKFDFCSFQFSRQRTEKRGPKQMQLWKVQGPQSSSLPAWVLVSSWGRGGVQAYSVIKAPAEAQVHQRHEKGGLGPHCSQRLGSGQAHCLDSPQKAGPQLPSILPPLLLPPFLPGSHTIYPLLAPSFLSPLPTSSPLPHPPLLCLKAGWVCQVQSPGTLSRVGPSGTGEERECSGPGKTDGRKRSFCLCFPSKPASLVRPSVCPSHRAQLKACGSGATRGVEVTGA